MQNITILEELISQDKNDNPELYKNNRICYHRKCNEHLRDDCPWGACYNHCIKTKKWIIEGFPKQIPKKIIELENNINIKPNIIFKKWLAGFIDGDGCISVDIQKRGINVYVSISQSVLEVLKLINTFYKDGILNIGRWLENQRQQYYLRYCGKNAKNILEDIQPHIIIKKKLVDTALNILSLNKSSEHTALKKQLASKIKYEITNYRNDQRSYENVCPEYLAGLFDAEGAVKLYVKNSIYRCLNLAQRNDPMLLYFLSEIFEEGYVDNDDYFVVNNIKSITEFIECIYEYTIVKKVQLNMMMKSINTKKIDHDQNWREKQLNFFEVTINEKYTGRKEFTPFHVNETLNKHVLMLKNEIYNPHKYEK